MDLKICEYQGKFYIHHGGYGRMQNNNIRQIIYPMRIMENDQRKNAANRIKWQTDINNYIVYDTAEAAQKFIDHFCAICVEIKLS